MSCPQQDRVPPLLKIRRHHLSISLIHIVPSLFTFLPFSIAPKQFPVVPSTNRFLISSQRQSSFYRLKPQECFHPSGLLIFWHRLQVEAVWNQQSPCHTAAQSRKIAASSQRRKTVQRDSVEWSHSEAALNAQSV